MFKIMAGLKTLLPLFLFLSTTTALPTLEQRGSTTCGSTYYTASKVSAASSKGYADYQDGTEPGGYPHTYHNYEGFDFPVDGPYQEFPLLSSGSVYTGGMLHIPRRNLTLFFVFCPTHADHVYRESWS